MDTKGLIKQGKVGMAFQDVLMGALVLTISLSWRSVIEKFAHIVIMNQHWFERDGVSEMTLQMEAAARDIDFKTQLASASFLTGVVLLGSYALKSE